MSVLLLLGLSRAAWPAVCTIPPALAADFHPAEARYAVAMGTFRTLVANHTAEEQRVYDEKLQEYRPVPPVLSPPYRLQAVVGDLLVDIAAHAMLVGNWEAAVFDGGDASLVFGDIGHGPARVFTATRNALVTAGQSVCPRGAIPSRAVFVKLYEALSMWNATEARRVSEREAEAERQFRGEYQVPGASLVPSWMAKIWDDNFVEKF
jgi:hypothetical protein